MGGNRVILWSRWLIQGAPPGCWSGWSEATGTSRDAVERWPGEEDGSRPCTPATGPKPKAPQT